MSSPCVGLSRYNSMEFSRAEICERQINPAVPHDYDPLENNSSWRHEEVVGDTTRWWPAVMKHFHWITTETCVVDTCVTAKSSVSAVSAVLACIVVKRTEIFQRSTVAERILILNRQHTHQTRLVMCSNNKHNIGCLTDSHSFYINLLFTGDIYDKWCPKGRKATADVAAAAGAWVSE